MFDEKYMQSHDKPVESVEDALFIMTARQFCGGTPCSKCALIMYGEDCSAVKDKANKILGVDGKGNGDKKQQVMYEMIFEKGLQKPEEPEQTCKGTCAECYFSKMHTSGIRWCEKFCNFVHEDVYCYRFSPSDNMEAEGAK